MTGLLRNSSLCLVLAVGLGCGQARWGGSIPQGWLIADPSEIDLTLASGDTKTLLVEVKNVGYTSVMVDGAGFSTLMPSQILVTEFLSADCDGRLREEGDMKIRGRECATFKVHIHSDVADTINNEIIVPWTGSGSALSPIRIPVRVTRKNGADGGQR